MKTLLKGFICDGNNEPSRRALLIENDRIIALEKDIYGSAAADSVISFKNEIIAPGFIDAHGHSELSLPANPAADSKRNQGFTTEIIGNCGLSVFPVTDKNRTHLQELYAGYPVKLSWNTLPEYQQILAARNAKLRIFSLCGHNTLRAAVAGYEKEELSPEEIAEMQNLLRHALHDGALGLSTGLLYVPGCFATENEIVKLMQVLSEYDRVYATHLRSEGDKLLESLEMTFQCAVRAKLKRVQISHFKTAGAANWHKLDAALELIAHYRQLGVDIHVDRYPYLESQTMLSVILPPPFDTMRDAAITAELRDGSARRKLLTQLRNEKTAADWARLRLTGCRNKSFQKFIGRHFPEIPGDPAANCLEMLAEDATKATISAAGMSEANLHRILAQDFCMPGSDGYAFSGDSSQYGNRHPRSFGTAAKFMRILLDDGVSIGKAVARMSALPANFFRLTGCGTFAPGNFADITVFDPESIDSHADFLTPDQPPSGIIMSASNGEFITA